MMANTTTRRNWMQSSGAVSAAALLAAAGAKPMAAAAAAIEELCSGPGEPGASAHVAALRAFEAPYQGAFPLLDRAAGLDAAGWEEGDRPRRNSLEEARSGTLLRLNAARIGRPLPFLKR